MRMSSSMGSPHVGSYTGTPARRRARRVARASVYQPMIAAGAISLEVESLG